MTFEVVVSEDVFKAAEKWLLPAQLRRLIEFIQALPESPFPRGFNIRPVKGKRAKELGADKGRKAYRVRFGDYRLFYVVNWKKKTIQVVELRPRERAY